VQDAELKLEADDPLDTVSGTTGLTGAADTVLVLKRDSAGVVLYGRGRDIEEIETALQFDRTTGRWVVLGAASEVRRSDERAAIVNALAQAGRELSPREIADVTGLSHDSVRHLVVRLAGGGEIGKTARGKYVHNVHSVHNGKEGQG
jgi:hypothetical protein